MRPYYRRAGITIYHADCQEVLCGLQAESPVIVTDPPYGIRLTNNDRDGHRRASPYRIIGDDGAEASRGVLSFAERLRLPTIAFASPWHPWPGRWRNLIVWDKGESVGGGGDICTCLKRSWELIQVARNRPTNGPRLGSVWRYPVGPSASREHIAAKPVALMAALLRVFTRPGDCILDPFAGSGSTLVAAAECGRPAVGIEFEEKYCEIAARRIDAARLEQRAA